jgi:hypothetical protein
MGYFGHSFTHTFFSILHSILLALLVVSACIIARRLGSFFAGFLTGRSSTCCIFNYPFAAIS